MLYTSVSVNKGIIFVKVSGNINSITIKELDDIFNHLIYNIGVKYFAIDFISVTLDKKIIPNLNNKLLEVYYNCEKLSLNGLNDSNLLDLSFAKVGNY